jgi:xylulokinase
VLALVAAAPPKTGRLTCSMGSSSMVFYPLENGENITDAKDRIYTYPLLAYPLIGGVSSTSGASITWAAKTLFGELPFEEAIARTLTSPPGADGLLFLPFLSGERSPFWNDAMRGSFYGLTLNHDRGDMLRAVLEGVAFSLRYLCDVFRENGVPISEIALAGGANNIQGLPQIVANVNQLPVSIFTGQETVTHGLYAYACQVLEKDIPFGIALKRTFGDPPEIINPERTLEKSYSDIYQKYCTLAEFADKNL